MTFQDSVRICFSKYTDFQGRAGRSEYWWFALFVVGLTFLVSMVSRSLSGLVTLAVLVPSLAVAARRLHDTGRSGWWQLIGFVPVVGAIVLIVFLAQEGKTSGSTTV